MATAMEHVDREIDELEARLAKLRKARRILADALGGRAATGDLVCRGVDKVRERRSLAETVRLAEEFVRQEGKPVNPAKLLRHLGYRKSSNTVKRIERGSALLKRDGSRKFVLVDLSANGPAGRDRHAGNGRLRSSEVEARRKEVVETLRKAGRRMTGFEVAAAMGRKKTKEIQRVCGDLSELKSQKVVDHVYRQGYAVVECAAAATNGR